MKLKGDVTRRRKAIGSKSEYPAEMLNAAGKDFVLRRVGGNPFRDQVLESLVGKKVECEGKILANNILLCTSCEVLDL